MKTCTKCLQEKPLTEFSTNGKDGYYTICKDCKNAEKREWRKTTAGNDASRVKDIRKRAKFHGVRYEPYKPSEIFERDNYTCQMCGKTNLQGRDLTIDHIMPMDKGGHDVVLNLQTLCRKCNRLKHNNMYFWSIPDKDGEQA